jgi:4-amino-4-deoxy-L-arabinose transferase-like glycosyltransferase
MQVQQPFKVGRDEQPEQSHEQARQLKSQAPEGERQVMLGRVLLLLSLLTGAILHGYHLFLYPLYITDEGIYMQQAWSVLREGRLSPYTYFYDHAPAGWLMIAAWVSILPHQFEAFGNAINTGRVLMLLVHIASTFLLFQVARRLSGSLIAAVVATFFFNLSPLAIYYQRQVLLDNLMVFWVLLSLYLAASNDRRVLTPLLSGLALGICVVTKENAIFFVPVIGYLLYSNIRQRRNFSFAFSFWLYTSLSVISLYFLYAVLKNELLPAHLNFNLNQPPAEHVSLLYTIWQQLHRSQGSILDRHSLVWMFSLGAWLPKDTFLLAGGAVATLVNLFIGVRDRRKHRGELVAALLALSYAFYLARGSVALEFYVIPLIPFAALNIGLLAGRILRLVPQSRRLPLLAGSAQALILGVSFAVLLLPPGGYVLVHNQAGKVALHDLYKLPLTPLQAQQLAFIRQHIPPSARIVMDDDLWVQLHDVQPYYPFAHSHWKASSDPAVRDKLFARNWRNIDYIVLSNKMVTAMQQNNTDGSENYILEALSHGKQIWSVTRGNISLAIFQIQK